jgi:CelD/BcsL family acetyltransferase involved in cellulose biosynthesis
MQEIIELHAGDEASSRFLHRSFLDRWHHLYEDCPWATSFQSPEYTQTWFDCYHEWYKPVLIHQSDGRSGLRGLLVLALTADGSALTVAGGHQAEYQSWLAAPGDDGTFIIQALDAVRAAFPQHDLAFRYLPPEVPLQGLSTAPPLAGRIRLTPHLRPLMAIDKADLDESFRKKSNRSRFNRLKRLGTFSFGRVTDARAFSRDFDAIIAMYDFRQAAVNDLMPFAEDPQKEPFHLELLRRHPQMMHVTVSALDGRPIAAHLGLCGRDRLHLGIVTHAPDLGRHSPGKLHLMLLGRLLSEEGVRTLDLTAGEDPWKDNFANAHDTVHELIVYGSPTRRALQTARTRSIDWARAAVGRAGFEPAQAKRLAHMARSAGPAGFAEGAGRMIRQVTRLDIYRRAVKTGASGAPDDGVRRDDLAHLLRFTPDRPWRTRQAFLAEALHRLESGEHVYTCVSGGRLVHCAWLAAGPQSMAFPEVGQSLAVPEGSAVLYDAYTCRDARSQGLFQRTLRQMLADAGRAGDIREIHLAVPAGNGPAHRIVEKLGFHHDRSLVHSRLLGFSRRWTAFGAPSAGRGHDRLPPRPV